MAPTADDTSDQFTVVVRKSSKLAAAKKWLKTVRRKIHAGQSKSEKPATKVKDPLGLAAPKIRRTRGGRMAQGHDDMPIFAERARLAKWTPEGIASLPELFKPLPKDGNFKVVDEFKNVLMVVRRVASDTEQDKISAAASALHRLHAALEDRSLANVPGCSITVNRHAEQLGPDAQQMCIGVRVGFCKKRKLEDFLYRSTEEGELAKPHREAAGQIVRTIRYFEKKDWAGIEDRAGRVAKVLKAPRVRELLRNSLGTDDSQVLTLSVSLAFAVVPHHDSGGSDHRKVLEAMLFTDGEVCSEVRAGDDWVFVGAACAVPLCGTNTLVSLDGGQEWHGTPMMRNPSRKRVGSALMSKDETVQGVDKLLP
jgi:hypothetical protein